MNKENINNIKGSGFKIPKDYFENLEDHLLNQSKLKNAADQTGFKVPDVYFETLEQNILNQVSKKETIKVISLFTKRNIIFMTGIAAAILLLLNLSIFQSESKWDSLDSETVENYLLNEDIGPYEIASTLGNIDFSEENFVDQHINENILETYLLENMDMENLLIE